MESIVRAAGTSRPDARVVVDPPLMPTLRTLTESYQYTLDESTATALALAGFGTRPEARVVIVPPFLAIFLTFELSSQYRWVESCANPKTEPRPDASVVTGPPLIAIFFNVPFVFCTLSYSTQYRLVASTLRAPG